MGKTSVHKSNEVERAKTKWDDAHSKANYKMRFAMSHPVVRKYVNKNYLGGGMPLSVLKSHIDDPVDRALELACGRGDLALAMIENGYAKHVDAIDVSDAAVVDAQNRASAKGLQSVNFKVADVNTIELEPNTYDLIYFSQSLHHIEALEHVYEQVSHELKSDGIFYVNDYVGPSRMQWSDKQLEIMNEILSILPEHYRELLTGDLGYQGTHKEKVHRTPVAIYLKVDPSEGVRSAEILPLVKKYFDVIDERPWGGTLHYELLRGIIHNFDINNENDTAILEMILKMEQLLITNNVIGSDFMCFVAKKRA
jgi:ubiquinone/menaquinone biosynthesis C-methylase UbiE